MIELDQQAAKLIKFTPYTEMHGKEPEPGCALRLEFNVPSDFLEGFDPMLRSFMWHKLGATQHDLADQTADAPDLRFPKLEPRYLWRQRYDGSTLTIHLGDREDNAIVLDGKVKKPFSLTPKQGGTLVVGMTVNCHPSPEQAGILYGLQKHDLRVSFDPGEEVDDEDSEGEEGEGGEE